MNVPRIAAALAAVVALGGCAATFHSHEPLPSTYTLRARAAGKAVGTPLAATLVIAQPTTRPGFDTDRIVVTLPDRRVDAYAGARWSAPVPELVEGLLLDGFRNAGGFHAVVTERSAFGGRYLLQLEIDEFAADYGVVGGLPVARVALHGEIGVSGERHLIGVVAGSAAVAASADRQREVAAAFEAACADAAEQVIAAVNAAAALDAASHH